MMSTKRRRIKLSNPSEVRKALSRVVNMVLNDELDARQANCIVAACNVILSGIRTDEQQKKLDELERMLTNIQEDKASTPRNYDYLRIEESR